MRRLTVLAIMIALLTASGSGPAPLQAQSQPQAPAQAQGEAALPGRMLFLSDQQVTLLKGGQQWPIPLPAGMTAPVLSPDGRRVAGIVDGQVALLPTGVGELATLGAAPGPGSRIAWSPSGDRLAAFSGKVLAIYRAGGGDGPRVTLDEAIAALHWSPDSRRLVAETGGGLNAERSLWLVDRVTGAVTLLARSASSPAWSPDGALAYAVWKSDLESEVALWREGAGPATLLDEAALVAAAPEQAQVFEQTALAVYSLRWSPSGDRLVVRAKAAGPHNPHFLLASVKPDGGDPRLWVLPVHPEAQPKNVYVYPPLGCTPGAVVWAGEGRLATALAGPGCEGTLALLDAATLEVEQEVTGLPEWQKLVVSPDGAWLAYTGGDHHTIISLANPAERVVLTVPGELAVWSDPIALPGRIIIAGEGELVQVAGGEEKRFPLPEGFHSPTLSPDGRWVVGIAGEEVVLLSLEDGHARKLGPAKGESRLAWSSDSVQVTVYGAGRSIRRYGIDGRPLGEITLPEGPVVNVAFAPGSAYLAAATGPNLVEEQSLWLVDLATGRERKVMDHASGPFWSPDGRILFLRHHLPSHQEELLRLSPGGGEPERVLNEAALLAAQPELQELLAKNEAYTGSRAWAPAGDQLAVSMKAAGPDPRFLVATLRPDGSALSAWVLPLYKEDRANRNQYPPRPCSPAGMRWALGGEMLVVPMKDPGCKGAVQLLTPAAQPAGRLEGLERDLGFEISPDGRWAAFMAVGKLTVVDLTRPLERVELKIRGELLGWK
jgi:Tol biopolymer transport system component